jgi:ribonuclease R
LRLPGGVKPQTSDYADLLSEVRGRPDSHLIQTVLLRSLSQAVYSAENQGHFGLSFAAYAHFTSPIRRYPDLIVHRAIRHLLKGGTLEDFDYTQTELQGLGEHCSATERRADEATRDVTSWLKCEYMMDKIGEDFVGIITSVTSFGIFVELDEIYVDGLVHITALDNDYYHFDPVGRRLTGERSGMVYRLGDQVKIKVAAVNLDERKIDFILLEAVSAKAKSRRSKKGPVAPADGSRSREDSGKTRRKKAQGPSAAPAAKAEKPASGKAHEQAPGKKRRSARRRGKPKAE